MTEQPVDSAITRTEYKINKQKLQELFSYHPAFTPEIKNKYDIVDNSFMDLVLSLSEVITNPEELNMLLRQLQQLKMQAKQAVTNESIDLDYKDIYETE